ncbi:hypothetical protein GGX14DRAFT_402973 [Mycena pura]|uniref:Uncharacterized protein n=1 Tax=Mycena pura TaxID=153505 RepID=A0AAD6V3V8_9AGAR|nr:hypothetical protein GGX14DRAFT_402973 [Mycena pura]
MTVIFEQNRLKSTRKCSKPIQVDFKNSAWLDLKCDLLGRLVDLSSSRGNISPHVTSSKSPRTSPLPLPSESRLQLNPLLRSYSVGLTRVGLGEVTIFYLASAITAMNGFAYLVLLVLIMVLKVQMGFKFTFRPFELTIFFPASRAESPICCQHTPYMGVIRRLRQVWQPRLPARVSPCASVWAMAGHCVVLSTECTYSSPPLWYTATSARTSRNAPYGSPMRLDLSLELEVGGAGGLTQTDRRSRRITPIYVGCTENKRCLSSTNSMYAAAHTLCN